MFRAPTVQLPLHVGLYFRRYGYFFLFRWDELVQIPNPRNRKAAFTFRIVFSFQRFWLFNFLLAHVTSSESEIRGIEMLFFFLFALPLPSLVACAAACTTQSSTAAVPAKYSASLVSKRSVSCLRKSVTVIQVS